MTDTPLIRGARALAKADSGEDCYDALDEGMQLRLQESVRAVLEAVREPSEDMWSAGYDQVSDPYHWGPEPDDEGRRVWQAMIDAALSE